MIYFYPHPEGMSTRSIRVLYHSLVMEKANLDFPSSVRNRNDRICVHEVVFCLEAHSDHASIQYGNVFLKSVLYDLLELIIRVIF